MDACIHFAAKKSVSDSMQWPGRYFRVNTASALELIDALHQSGVRRFVLSSTAAVYGTPSVVPVTEDLPLAPGEPVRREQAPRRADAPVVRHLPRVPLGQPALLQRRRRGAGRFDR